MLEKLFDICTQILQNQRQIMEELGIESQYEEDVLKSIREIEPTTYDRFQIDKGLTVDDLLTPKIK